MSPNIVVLAASITPFALSMGLTPGPNNIMLANSGATFGVRRTLPLGAGVVVGFSFLVGMVGLTAAGTLHAAPFLFTVMKVVSVAYILYLAWKIAMSAGPGKANRIARPLTFLQGVAFQWINPKGWVIALGAAYAYTSAAYDLTIQLMVLCAIFFLTSILTAGTWTVFGNAIGRVLRTERQRKMFNYAMAGLLVLSIVPILTGE